MNKIEYHLTLREDVLGLQRTLNVPKIPVKKLIEICKERGIDWWYKNAERTKVIL